MAGKAPTYKWRQVLSLFQDKAIPPEASPGLVFERYMRLWTTQPRSRKRGSHRARGGGRNENEMSYDGFRRLEWEDEEGEDNLKKALQDFVRDYQKVGIRLKPVVKTLCERLTRALEMSLEGDAISASCLAVRKLRLASRMALGTGSDHPLENGLTLDDAMGVPIVPGSAIKGLCRKVAEVVGLPEETKFELFGHDLNIPGSSQSEMQAGDIVFHTAWPEDWPRLEIDVINCHHTAYYGDVKRRGKPVDYESPVPVYFLAVAPGTIFIFQLQSRSGNRGNLELSLDLLQFGLETLSIGSKTAVGYGHWQAGDVS